jgi:hypothetical protein
MSRGDSGVDVKSRLPWQTSHSRARRSDRRLVISRLTHVIERYASGSTFMRVLKVQVTSPQLHGPTTGFTVEVDK